MLPNQQFIKIHTNEELISELLNDLLIQPRGILKKWSDKTRQTMQVRVAYLGQHLASLITGVEGTGSAARGFDLGDRSEIKTCSRVDQLGRCDECGSAVLSQESNCRNCNSDIIKRKTDSHWIFSMKSEENKRALLKHPRIILLLFDSQIDIPSDIQIRAWEIWPKSKRHNYFKWFVEDYWRNNYRPKILAGKKIAPLNLHPLKYDFHVMNPLPIFRAVIEGDNNNVRIEHWIKPFEDRSRLESEPMPAEVLTRERLLHLINQLKSDNLFENYYPQLEKNINFRTSSKKEIATALRYIPEEARSLLPRPVKKVRAN